MKKCIILLLVSVFLSFPVFSEEVIKNDLILTTTGFTPEMLKKMKDSIGVRVEGKNYNIIVDGHGTGFAPPSEDEYNRLLKDGKIVISATNFRGTRAPGNYDNSTSIHFPPVGNQRYEGSCAAWSMGYYIKTYQEAMDRNWDLSAATYYYNWVVPGINEPAAAYQKYIMSPDFAYHQVNGGADAGSSWISIAELFDVSGCSSWEKMPYDDQDSTTYPDEAAYREGVKYQTDGGAYYMDATYTSTINTMKDLLATNTLISFCIDANEFNFQVVGGQDLLVSDSYPTMTASCNHAQTVVGYDDSYGPYWEDGQWKNGAFKIVNSWGQWSDELVPDGYYYISYMAMQNMDYPIMFYYYDRENYEPEFIANVQVSHSTRGDVLRSISKITTSTYKIDYDERNSRGGDLPFSASNVIFDVTDLIYSDRRATYHFNVYDLANSEQYPLPYGDDGTANTGTINKFWIEDYTDPTYSDYDSATPVAIYRATDTPVSTINGSTVYSSLYANYIPITTWIGSGNYSTDGADPDIASSPTTFTFMVKYTDENNDAPETAQVWIDLDDSGSYSAGEKFDMSNFMAVDYFIDGVGYSYSREISFAGDGVINYCFYFNDGADVATGSPASDSSITVTPSGPYLSWTGTGNYTNSGVYPQLGNSGDLFNFSVQFSESDNTMPDTYEVWIDIDDSFSFENNEKFSMIEDNAGDTDLTDGKIYTHFCNIDFNGDGTLNFRFFFNAGGEDASGTPASVSHLYITVPQASDLNGLKIYPNPACDGSPIMFDELTENTKIRVYSISGELIFEKDTDDISYTWNCVNSTGETSISSGIYYYIVSNIEGEEKKGKIAIIK